MENSTKGISVIIPTYNYRHLLKKTLDSLCNQSLPKERYEVIVVDDGSSDNTFELIPDYKDRINILYMYQPDYGFRVASARNLGIIQSKHDIVLFFDSGMIASKNLLEKHLIAHQNSEFAAVIGLSYGVNEFCSSNFDCLSNIISNSQEQDPFQTLSITPDLYDCRFNEYCKANDNNTKSRNPWVIFWTGNASVSRENLMKIGIFDEYFKSWGGEDVELGIRLYKLGCDFEILPTMEAIHAPHDKDAEQKVRDSRKNIQYICKKHPEEDFQLLKTMSWQEIYHFKSNKAKDQDLEAIA